MIRLLFHPIITGHIFFFLEVFETLLLLLSVETVKCLCTCLQEIDNLIHNNLADIVVELLMTLYEGTGSDSDGGGLALFTG